MVSLDVMADYVQEGKVNEVKGLVQQAIDGGMNPKDVLDNGLISGMDIIGKKFKANEVYVPEILIAAKAMHAGLKVLEPILVRAGVKLLGKVAFGTVKGDLHDIGKNLVAMLFKGAGFEVVDLGVDVPADKFLDAVENQGVILIGISALLTTTMPGMKVVIDKIKETGSNVEIMVGGAPVTKSYAEEIRADGYAPDAASAIEEGKTLLGMT